MQKKRILVSIWKNDFKVQAHVVCVQAKFTAQERCQTCFQQANLSLSHPSFFPSCFIFVLGSELGLLACSHILSYPSPWHYGSAAFPIFLFHFIFSYLPPPPLFLHSSLLVIFLQPVLLLTGFLGLRLSDGYGLCASPLHCNLVLLSKEQTTKNGAQKEVFLQGS